jgi:hypothetical protein
MRLKAPEQEHIAAVGDRWAAILAATTLSVRQNSKLVGLDKIREPLATQAALKATGYEIPGFFIPKAAGGAYVGTQEVVDAAFAAAVEAGERAFVSA